MTPPSERIGALFNKTRTICVGRFLLDIPDSATVAFGRTDTPFETYRYEGDAENMDKIIAGYISRLNERKDLAYGALVKPDSMLGKVVDGPVPGQKILFDFSDGGGEEYHLKSLTKVGKDLFLQSVDTFADRSYYSRDLAEINDSAARLVARDVMTQRFLLNLSR
ncbi:hypothetical protein [Massilia endophytica]|uniref:hypothetical protein n=1 Tax=Massilia endophytica TaxID=2899220 RepID=UPI001E3DD18B|nr:hypothetical protein [Massilia endophytica]UGQ46145.1 hypothetical protein LSQ66_20615 [Massilia endophytica]